MVLRPVGPRPAGVYWRRRLVLLLVLAVVIVLLVHACSGGGGKPATGGTPTLTPSTPSTLAKTPVTACGPGSYAITVAAAAPDTTAGTPLGFKATVRLGGAQPCRLLVPPSAETWRISLGGSTVWTDAGCQPTTAGVHRVLRPGHPAKLSETWSGKRSAAGCQAGAAAGPGTYHATLQLGQISSRPATFTLSQS